MSKVLIKAVLKAQTQLHVSTGEPGSITDAPLYRRVDGTIVIPGTSIAGCFRSRATHIFQALTGEKPCLTMSETNDQKSKSVCQCSVCRLFGDIHPDASNEGRLSSKLLFHDAEVGQDPVVSIQDGIGIDRNIRTASRESSAKYDFETLPAGTLVSLKIECTGLTKLEEKLLAALFSEINEGRIRFGGKSARGLGRMKLEKVNAVRLPGIEELEDFINLLATDDWFSYKSFDMESWYQERTASLEVMGVVPPSLHISGRLNFVEAFLTKDGFRYVGGSFDAIPATVINEGKITTSLPGSTLRGILRFQAERIVRTLATNSSQDFYWSVCNPFVEDESRPDVACSRRKGDDMDKDCLACWLFGSTNRGSRLKVSDALLVEQGQFFIQDQVAIDRFTGGSSDGKKFDAVVVYQPQYEFELLLEEPELWEIGWLLLVLRDLDEGLVAIGSGSAKGFGFAQLNDVYLTVIGEFWSAGNQSQSGVFEAKKLTLEEAYQTGEINQALKLLQEKVASVTTRRVG